MQQYTSVAVPLKSRASELVVVSPQVFSKVWKQWPEISSWLQEQVLGVNSFIEYGIHKTVRSVVYVVSYCSDLVG